MMVVERTLKPAASGAVRSGPGKPKDYCKVSRQSAHSCISKRVVSVSRQSARRPAGRGPASTDFTSVLDYNNLQLDSGEPAVVWLPGYSTPGDVYVETPGAYGGLAARLQYSRRRRDTGEPAVVWLPGYGTPGAVEIPGSLRTPGAVETPGAYGGLAARLQYSQRRRDTGEPTVVWHPGYSTPSAVEIPGYRGACGDLATRLQYSQRRRVTGEPAVVWHPGYSTPGARYRGACGGLAARLQYSQRRRDTGKPAVVWLPGYSTPSAVYVEIPGSLRWSGIQATVLPAPLQYSQRRIRRDTGEPAVIWLPGYSTPSAVEIPGSLPWSGIQATVLPAPLQYSRRRIRRDTGEPAVVWLPGYSTHSAVKIPGACGGLATWLQYSRRLTRRDTGEPAVVWLPGYSTPSARYRGACGGLAARLQYSRRRRDTGEPAVVWHPGYSTPGAVYVEIPGSLRWSGIQATVTYRTSADRMDPRVSLPVGLLVLVLMGTSVTGQDGGWSDWVDGDCSVSCGDGVMTQTRTCTNPEPANGGAQCTREDGTRGLDEDRTESCNQGACPIDGGWSDWVDGDCSVSCGDGVMTQTRTCTNPEPANGGAQCTREDGTTGLAEDRTASCTQGACPIGALTAEPSLFLSQLAVNTFRLLRSTAPNTFPGIESKELHYHPVLPVPGDLPLLPTAVHQPAVSDSTFSDIEMDQMTLSWRASDDVRGYRLRYRHAGASYQDLSPPPAPGDTQATVRGLWAGTEYTFTLTAFGEDDEQIGEISGTETTAEVIVNVDCHQDHMSVTFPRKALKGVDVDTLHLSDDTCRATYTETEVTLRTGLQECGTTQESSEDKLIFSNEAFGSPVVHDNGAVRGATFSKSFQCEFVSQFVISQEQNILFNIPSPRFKVVSAENQFTFEMHMFPSANFAETYRSADYPVQVTPTDQLHFGLSVNSPLDNLELFALHCLATPSDDPEDSPSVNIIQDGCHIDQTLQLNTALSGDMASYYSIQSFTFPNVEDPSLVYIHCTMVVCFKHDPDSRCSEGCIPATRRRRAVSDMSEARVRRASETDETVTISQGPFKVVRGEKQASAVPAIGIAVGTAAGIAGVLLMVAAVFLVRKRRGRDVKEQAEDRVGFDNYSFELWGKDKAANATPKPEQGLWRGILYPYNRPCHSGHTNLLRSDMALHINELALFGTSQSAPGSYKFKMADVNTGTAAPLSRLGCVPT
ncbi:hypothetical protein Bbelb_277580 [Branchiostoma belcheri]|nr:hypothetical protein Bbelb_277580 [Branchiostoma belcheri]